MNRNIKRVMCLAVIVITVCIILATSAESVEKDSVEQAEKPKVEVLFILDTTGSMSSLIEAAKGKIWAIANTLSTADPAPEIKMGVIGYRDRNDKYITKVSPLTSDIDSVYVKLMDFKADGGGDTPESVNQALFEGVNKIEWSHDKNTYRVVFLVGDAPPHMDYDEVQYETTAKKAAERNIIINTIQCGGIGGTEPVWRKIAKLAGGKYFRVSQEGDAVYYETPYDDKISDLSVQLDKTRIYYGSADERKKCEKRNKTADKIYAECKKNAVAQRSSYNVSGAGKDNFLGRNELVDAFVNKKLKIEDMKKEDFPAIMQKMTMSERKQYLEKLSQQRDKIRKQIKTLAEKRQQNILKQVKKQGEKGRKSFDMKIYKSISEQAKEKNIEYKSGPKY